MGFLHCHSTAQSDNVVLAQFPSVHFLSVATLKNDSHGSKDRSGVFRRCQRCMAKRAWPMNKYRVILNVFVPKLSNFISEKNCLDM